ncbi:MAG TPA: hypothetical protein VFV38_25590 [Ktedonobacteraceae bacterium]|nr:hypothetical protein [Ktedonobacteraceae bacterium]
MNMSCPQCGTTNVPAHQPCPYCGLLRDGSPQALTSQPMPSRASRSTPGSTGIHPQTLPVLILPKGATLEKERYLLLEPRSVQQWSSSIAETLWHAHEREPETGAERSVLIADVALPTYRQHQEVSRAARRAFLDSEEPQLINTFLEREHAFFVFAEVQGESLQQRIDRQALLREEEAVRALHELARTMVRLSNLQPPIMHGWISPAHLIQRGTTFRVLPASVLVAGGAAHFLDGTQAPAGISAAFHPGNDVFAAIRTVYAGLTGILPPPNHGLPLVRPHVSTPFAALLAHGLQSTLTPTELLTELSSMLGVPTSASPRHAGSRFSGPLAPASRFAASLVASEVASVAQEPFLSRLPQVASEVASVARDFPPGPQQTDPPDAGQTMPAYPQASDGLHAVYWSSAILAAEALFLLLSH